MRALPFVWPYALVFWLAYFWSFAAEYGIVRRGVQGIREAGSPDSGSLRVLLIAQSLALLAAIILAALRVWQFPISLMRPLFAFGVTLTLLGSLLRRYCTRTLGVYFTGDVRARSEQPVIRSGPYRFVRHPSYTGGIMMFTGIGFALGSVLGLLLVVVTTVVAYGYRVAVEERALVAAIGEPYRVYMTECKRFIPYVV
jgi:isoprenylcysteine carboxyl methyltransferase (ICMT) family protein YpbQ